MTDDERPSGARTAARSELLEDAARLARHFGLDPEFSRGGGGNVSVKTDGVLYIKPSGVALSSLAAGDLMPLDLEPLVGLLSLGSDDRQGAGSESVMAVAMTARIRPAGAQRPSVEVLFHALMPRRFVLHTHPTIVNSVCCARDGARIAEQLFGDAVLWVPYVDPGLPLARAISQARHAFEESTGSSAPDVLLLQSHGLIAAADEPAAISAASRRVVETIRAHLADLERGIASGVGAPSSGAPPPRPLREGLESVLRAILSSESRPEVVIFDGSSDAMRAATSAAGRSLVVGGPITPDQIVYAGSWPLWLDAPSTADARQLTEWVGTELALHIDAHRALPSIVVVAGLGLFAAGDSPREAEIARDVYLDAIRIGFNALQLGGVRVLEPEERRFIEDWEAEAYRRGVAAAAQA